MNDTPQILRVIEAGRLTVVGFDARRIPDDHRYQLLRDDLVETIEANQCQELAFDLTGVKVVPSQLLGLMAWFSRNGLSVSVLNPSEEIRDTLQFTQLDTIIEVGPADG